MPWQRLVLDVALEIDPATNELYYKEIGLTVPRQSGKSTLILVKATHRAMATEFFGRPYRGADRRQKLVYTAQTRQKAREKWDEDYRAQLEASRSFGRKIKVNLRGGDEHLRFDNGSRFGIESNTEKAGHGSTIDEAYIDEAFGQADFRLEQAFRPAMITRRNKQLWWISTAGWLDGSPYLEPKVAMAQQVVLAGESSRLAYFEWSADEDADPGDPAVWWGCMPALGHTITEQDIRDEYERFVREGRLHEFRRAFLNQWVAKELPPEPVISTESWRALTDVRSSIAGPVVFAVETAEDRSRTAIAAAGRNHDGRVHVELVKYGRGQAWVLPELIRLTEAWDAKLIIDGYSPAASHIAELQEVGIAVEKTSTAELARACGNFADWVESQQITHLGDPELDRLLPVAISKPLSGGWAWDRKSGPLSPLVAVTLAAYGVLLQRDDEAAPQIHGWPDEDQLRAWEASAYEELAV